MRKLIDRIILILQIWKGGAKVMVDVYIALIVHTDQTGRTIDSVPVHLRPAVLAGLAALGLDGYGQPLQP